ncbi:MAG: phosphatidate cytidylyltransferase [Candidatus Dormibacteria bacterium]
MSAGDLAPPLAVPRRGRMGGLGLRLVSGVALLILVAAAVAAGGDMFTALVAAAAVVGAWEFARLARRTGAAPPLWLLLPLAGWLAIRFALPPSVPVLDIAAGTFVVGGVAAVLAGVSDWRGWMVALGGAVYTGFTLSFYVALLDWRPADHLYGIRVLAVPVAAVVLCDTGAYVAGSLLGRHPFFPHLSPKKSLEGAVAAVLTSLLAGLVLAPLLLGLPAWTGALLGVLVAVAAQAGDLAESALKRQAGVKDSGVVVPGHGGLLDRLDSLVLVAPAAYCLYRLAGLS